MIRMRDDDPALFGLGPLSEIEKAKRDILAATRRKKKAEGSKRGRVRCALITPQTRRPFGLKTGSWTERLRRVRGW